MRRVTTFLCMSVLIGALIPTLGYAKKKKDDSPKDLFEPQRLTAGASNQFMGSFTGDGKALYFVSDTHVSTEIFVQDPVESGAELVFDENADVGQPQISADGKTLAYISYRSDSTGDVCLRDMVTRESWCKTGLESADLQVRWSPNGKNLLILKREGINGSMRLVAMSPDSESKKEAVLLERNMLRPSLHVDGNWFAYIPLTAGSDVVGVSFSQKSTPGIALYKRGGKTVLYTPALPGSSSLPAFGPQGKYLYFVQYLNDTNGDGSIDGDDNAVIFRVPFDASAKNPTGGKRPEQLTSAELSCMYPSPQKDTILLTCSRQDSLDVYSLPSSGMVPVKWDAERVRGEVFVARDHWTKLLLLGRLYALDDDKESRVEVLREMLVLHLELREYSSASYYTKQIQTLAGKNSETGKWSQALVEVVRHREGKEALVRGMLSQVYVKEAKSIVKKLQAIGGTPTLKGLSLMGQAEVLATLGSRSDARALLDSIAWEEIGDPLTLILMASVAEKEMGLEGDREGLLALFQRLSNHPSLSSTDRLRYADRFIREVFRGRGSSERISEAKKWLKKLAPESELAVQLSVHEWLLVLNDTDEDEVRKGIFNLYKANKDKARRKALVLATIQGAAERDNEYLQYQFATTWASGLKRANPERKYSEILYQQIVLERAYMEWSKGEMSEARGYFFNTTMQTQSMEAHIGFIESWIAEGREDIEGHYAKQFKKKLNDPVYQFVKSYLLTRTLSEAESRKAHDAVVGAALKELHPATQAFPRSVEVQHLWATLLHHRYVHQGHKKSGIAALSHYLLALDLAQDNPRYLASGTQQLGLLQASLGNHRLALTAFEARNRLPFPRKDGRLNLEMAMARSLFYAGKPEEALEWSARAAKTLLENPELARFQVVLADRVALYSKEATRWNDSLAAYGRMDKALQESNDRLVRSPVNVLKAKLGKASAALGGGQYEKALEALDEVDGVLSETGPLRLNDPDRPYTPVDQYVFDREEYRIVSAGLRGRTNFALGRNAAATLAMNDRRDRIQTRFDALDLDEDLLELATSAYHLAEVAYQAKNLADATEQLEEGIRLSALYNERTGSIVNDVGRRLLQAYAELHLFGKVSLSTFGLDLQQELAVTYDFMCENPSPNWESDRFLLGVYLSIIESES